MSSGKHKNESISHPAYFQGHLRHPQHELIAARLEKHWRNFGSSEQTNGPRRTAIVSETEGLSVLLPPGMIGRFQEVRRPFTAHKFFCALQNFPACQYPHCVGRYLTIGSTSTLVHFLMQVIGCLQKLASFEQVLFLRESHKRCLWRHCAPILSGFECSSS